MRYRRLHPWNVSVARAASLSSPGMKRMMGGLPLLRSMVMSLLGSFLITAGSGCRLGGGAPPGSGNGHPGVAGDLQALRNKMVAEQIEARGVRTPAVLAAMRKVPRHLFIAGSLLPYAYEDTPLSIGEGQTISQPYIVALMTDLLSTGPGRKVLEVGTGSGYQAAVLSEMGAEVWTIEIVEPLAAAAKTRLTQLGYSTIRFRTGDGYRGWPEEGPFDGIIVTAAPERLPQPLVDQLRIGGRLVIPMGTGDQYLWVLTRTEEGVVREESIPVRFVPMTGEARKKRD